MSELFEMTVTALKVGLFCREGLSPQGEPRWGEGEFHVVTLPFFQPCLVAASREVLLGKQDRQ